MAGLDQNPHPRYLITSLSFLDSYATESKNCTLMYAGNVVNHWLLVIYIVFFSIFCEGMGGFGLNQPSPNLLPHVISTIYLHTNKILKN